IMNENGIGNFGLLLDIYKNHKNVNHYSSLRYKKGPLHRQSIPVIDIISCTASLADESMLSPSTAVFPVKKEHIMLPVISIAHM
ncbi:MAG: hypothetical protein II386_01130, partial [Bacteroidaceae bacterium]|nr:hypothetical protein [Bacteroidaceae bacterium]